MRLVRTPPSAQQRQAGLDARARRWGSCVKSSLPSSFCSSMQNGQWSVEIDLQVVLREPLPQDVLVPLLAQRRRHHVLGALESRLARSRRRRGTGTAGRSRRRRAGPCRAPASPSRARRRTTGGRCRSGRRPSRRARWRGRWPRPPPACGRVSAWYFGAVWPSRSASLTSVSITPPFSACMQIEAAVLAGLAACAEDRGVVHHEHAGVGHEELEAGDALVADHAVHVAEPCVGQVA